MQAGRAGTALVVALLSVSLLVAADGLTKQEGAWSVLVPAVLPGTWAAYEREEHTLHVAFDFEPWQDADGRETHAATMEQERDDIAVRWSFAVPPGPERRKFWHDDGEVLASLGAVGGGYAGAGVTSGGQLFGGTLTLYDTYAMRYRDGWLPVCGLIRDDMPTVVSGTRLRSAGCPAEMMTAAPQPSHGGTRVTFETGPVRVTFAPGVALPVEIDEGDGAWVLVALTEGVATPVAGDGAIHPVTMRGGAYPDESGIEHPFPLSVAFQEALSRAHLNGLGGVIQQPGAYLADASFTERVDEGTRHLEWRLTVSDGTLAHSATATRSVPQADQTAVGPVTQTGLAPAPATVVQQTASPQRPYPLEPQTPLRFPTLESLAARWEATEPYQAMPAWGFSVVCAATCKEATTITWYGTNMVRGVQEQVWQAQCTVLCEVVRRVPRVDALAVDSDGETVERIMTAWSTEDEAVLTSLSDQRPPPLHSTSDTPVAAGPTWGWEPPTGAAAVGLGVLGILAGALWYFAPALKFLAVGRSRALLELEHPVRREIQDVIRRTPGIHLHALERATGYPTGTIRHHLHRLEHEGAVVARRAGGYTCYFLARGTDRRVTAAAGALKAPAARQILARVIEGPVAMGTAAAAAGITPSAATHHAERLEQAGLVERHRNGRQVELHATPLASEALAVLS